ncbi:MAG TPA: PAS domain S-box protein [Microvirga sp.]|jgi:PAS domain S-box-containing protein|nr:PAS domain S-box protein [Microvirga sp.]
MHVLRPSLTLTLTPEIFRLIEGATASGAFANAEDVVLAALARMAAEPAAAPQQAAMPHSGTAAGTIQTASTPADPPTPTGPADSRLTELLEGIGEIFYALDREWRYSAMNHAAESYYGRPRSEMLGRVIWDLFPWSASTPMLDLFRRVMDSRRPESFSSESVAFPGRYLEVRVFPFGDGIGVSFRDWTQRAEAERALRESETRLKLAVEAGRLAVWEFDAVSGVLKPSPELNEILGFPREAAPTLDELRAGYLPGEQQRVQAAGQEALARGERFFQVEYRYRRRDGAVRWMLLRAEILFAPDRTLSSVVGVLLDVTERRATEEALRESEARLALATTAAELGIWDWQIATGTMIYSDRARAIYGLPPEGPLTYEAVRAATHPEDLPRTAAMARRALDPAIREKVPYEYRVVRPDGSVRWVLAHGEAVFAREDGEERAVRYVGTLQDITERKRAEVALRESEARLSALADNLPVGMVFQVLTRTAGPERRFLYLSRSCESLNGVSPEAALADPAVLYGLFEPESAPVLIAAEEEAIRGRKPMDVEVAMHHAVTGVVRWFRIISAPREAGDGWLVWDGLQVDVTERKRADEAVRRSEERLRTLLDQIPVGVALARIPTGEVVFHNATSVEILGHGLEPDAPAKEYGRYGAVHPDGTPYRAEEYPITRTLLRGERIEQEELLYRRGDGRIVNLSFTSSVVEGLSTDETFALVSFADVTERRQAEEHQRLLINELNHRVKNTLATVQSIAAQSFREIVTAQDPGAAAYARAAFEARIFALARAHDVLTRENWEGAGLAEIVEGAVAPYRAAAGADPVLLLGSDLRIPPRVALSLSMALHELCTNAVKYGALSQAAGRVRVVWRTHTDADGDRLDLRWEERGGPPVRPPTRRGFGSRLLEQGIARELGGDVVIAYDPGGVVCTIVVPLG